MWGSGFWSHSWNIHLIWYSFFVFWLSYVLTQLIGINSSKRLDFWKQISERVTLIVSTKWVWKQEENVFKCASVISLILLCNYCVHIHKWACLWWPFSWEELLLSGLSLWRNKKVSANPLLISMQCTLRFGIFILNCVNNNWIILSKKILYSKIRHCKWYFCFPCLFCLLLSRACYWCWYVFLSPLTLNW